MARLHGQPRKPPDDPTADRLAHDEAVAAKYEDKPGLEELRRRGDIDAEAYERAVRARGHKPTRPFAELIAALKAERERNGLSLSDVAERSGMDRAAIHKLEIGLNKNPTAATLARYADALGKTISWKLSDAG